MSALVATRGNQIVPILSWVEARSLSIPDQLSLVSLTYEPFMERLLPTITYYEENQTKTVHKLIRMLRSLTAGKISRAFPSFRKYTPANPFPCTHLPHNAFSGKERIKGTGKHQQSNILAAGKEEFLQKTESSFRKRIRDIPAMIVSVLPRSARFSSFHGCFAP